MDFLLKNLFILLGGRFGDVGLITGLSMPSPFGVPGRVPSVPAMLIWLGFLPLATSFPSPTWEVDEEAGKGIDSGAGGGVGSRSGGGMSVPSVREPKLSSGRAGSSNFFVVVEEIFAGGRTEVLFLVDMLGNQGCLREPW